MLHVWSNVGNESHFGFLNVIPISDHNSFDLFFELTRITLNAFFILIFIDTYLELENIYIDKNERLRLRFKKDELVNSEILKVHF